MSIMLTAILSIQMEGNSNSCAIVSDVDWSNARRQIEHIHDMLDAFMLITIILTRLFYRFIAWIHNEK